MATESALRDLLVDLEQGAPTVHDVLDRLHPATSAATPRRRPAWAVCGAVAACAAVIVGVGALSLSVTGRHSSNDASARSAALRAQLLPSWHLSVGSVPGYTVARDSIIRMGPVTSQAQQATVVSKTSRVTGYLEVSIPTPGQSLREAGNWKTVASGGEGPSRALRINGRAAYFLHPVALTPHELRSTHGNRWAAAAEYVDNQPRLYWQLPGKAVVELSGTFGFKPASATWNDGAALATLKRFAHVTTYSPGTSVNMPFRLAADPHGFIPLGVSVQPRSQCMGYGTGTIERRTDPTWNWYDVCRYSGNPASDLLETRNLVAARKLADGTTLGLYIGGWPGQATPITKSEARKILRAADVSPVIAAPSTWLPIQ